MARQRRLETIESFTDLKKCVHYCSSGGHLWVHDRPCKWTIKEKHIENFHEVITEVHKFFSVCPPHRLRYERGEEFD